MILEKDDNLRLANRLCDWLDKKGMTLEYFFDFLEEMEFAFPLRISDFTENEDNSFSFLCASVSDTDSISRRILLDADESSPRSITIVNVNGLEKKCILL